MRRPLPLLLLWAAALCRPAAASILVIKQQDEAAEYQLEDSPSRFGPRVSVTGLAVRNSLITPRPQPPPPPPPHPHSEPSVTRTES